MPKPKGYSSGIKLSREEREILRTKISKYGSSKEIARALESIDPKVITISGSRLTQQTLNHYLCHASERPISVSVACAIYKLCGEDPALKFLIEKRPQIELFSTPEYKTIMVGDMKTARNYANNILYDAATEILRGIFIEIDEARKTGLINDLEQLVDKYKLK